MQAQAISPRPKFLTGLCTRVLLAAEPRPLSMPILDIRNLTIEFRTARGLFRAVDGVALQVERGEVLAVAGEYVSGESARMLGELGALAWTGHGAAAGLGSRWHGGPQVRGGGG